MKPNFKALAFLSLPFLWSCASEGPVASEPTNPSDQPVERYLAINITDVNNPFGTRAGNSNDEPVPDYDQGKEHDINHGVFFFYDKDGNYISTGFIKKADWSDPGDDDENDNIEYLGKNIVTVPLNAKDGSEPKYMITLLNHGSSIPEYIYENKKSMKETAKLIAGYYPDETDGHPNGFMMSTSSYHEGTKGNIEKVYYNEIKEGMIKKSLNEADSKENTDILKVYVERLAAKVSLEIKLKTDGNNITETKTVGDVTYYKLSGAYQVVNESGDFSNPNNTTYSKEIWATVNSWGLCGTARESYISKQTDEAWDMDWFNRKDDHRSFWGMGKYYNADLKSEYNYKGNEGMKTPYDTDHLTLKYYSWSELNNKVNTSDNEYPLYCLEHTATPDKYTDNGKLISKNVTCAMLQTTLGCFDKDDKFQPLDVISYDGYLVPREITKDGKTIPVFLNYVLNELDKTGRLNYYHKKTVDGKDYFTQVGVEDFDIALIGSGEGAGTGKLKIVCKDKGTDVVHYKKDIHLSGEQEGQYATSYTPYAADYDIEKEINSWGTAMAYTGGAMYYYIPIRHNILSKDVAALGTYGVVRNHHYKITVTSLNKIGYGVFYPDKDDKEHPGEPLIPEDPDPQNHIKAEIKVLSWKLVNQNVDL